MEKLFEKKNQCCGCGACEAVCSQKAIEMIADREGFFYPRVNRRECINCGNCERVCPIKGRDIGTEKRTYWGAQAKDDKIRFSSSSGGVFSILARYILERGGVVFGAVMVKDGGVCHRDIQDAKGLPLLQKSKYVQSDITDCYKKVKEYLERGLQVMFTGTPCQCQAMKQYIGKECDRLLLVDLICYGVPSPGVWKKYLNELEKKYHEKVSGFTFRDKQKKDNGHVVVIKTENKKWVYSMEQDLFCRLYFSNYILRPSCHLCKFCTVERGNDITIGDFWGIEKVKPEMDDGMGTSVVILHNEKSLSIWNSVKKEICCFQCEKEDILQPRLCEPTLQARRRWVFWILNNFMSLSLTEKILEKLCYWIDNTVDWKRMRIR